jgi:hypothetical protein
MSELAIRAVDYTCTSVVITIAVGSAGISADTISVKRVCPCFVGAVDDAESVQAEGGGGGRRASSYTFAVELRVSEIVAGACTHAEPSSVVSPFYS